MITCAYRELCMDGHFDLAFSILRRYEDTHDFDFNFHSRCIIDHDNGIDHYEYCRLCDIEIYYDNKVPHYRIFSTIPPHPEMKTLKLKMHHYLHIMFPNMEPTPDCPSYKPPSYDNIRQLRIIFKDDLNFTSRDVYDTMYEILTYIHIIDEYGFFMYIINNMSPTDAEDIITRMYERNRDIMGNNTHYIIMRLISRKNLPKGLILLLSYLFNQVSYNENYKVSIGRYINNSGFWTIRTKPKVFL